MFKVLFGIYRDAGGLIFVVGTPYIYLAGLLTYLLWDRTYQTDWPSMAIGIFPSLVGFSLATFAIVLALFGSENLAKLAAKKEGKRVSALARLTALIVHSSMVQVLALISAFGLKQNGLCVINWRNFGWEYALRYVCHDLEVWNWVYVGGLFMTLYGLLLIVSTLLAVFQTSQMTR